MMIDTAPLLQVRQVTKKFPGVIALQDVDLRLSRGEVLALIGENGAGKSTLMKILAGVQEPDSGSIELDGKPIRIDSVQTATAHGIALIHQELNLSDNLDVGANIFLGREPVKNGLIDKAKIAADSAALLERVGLPKSVTPRTIVENLPIGQQQLVEIARALSVNARVLIMDEPTSSLSQSETETLFGVVKDLRSQGVSVIYISHRLGEVKELADRVTVMRDGENAGDLNGDKITHDEMVKLMVGRDVDAFYSREPHAPGDVVLEVKDLVTFAHPKHKLSFQVRKGEIVGVSGLVGAGRTEMLQVLFGVERRLGGTIRLHGKDVDLQSPLDAIEGGMALVPEDRKQQGVVLDMEVRTNIGLAGLKRHRKKLGWLNFAQERQDSDEMTNQLRIKTPSQEQIVQYLSGGNQQKVVLGKWLSMAPDILLLDEPTRGIDVGAKQEIYSLMEKLAASGMAILFVSSEMEEILGMADRVIVMHEGAITGELPRNEMNDEAIMQLATGNTSAK